MPDVAVVCLLNKYLAQPVVFPNPKCLMQSTNQKYNLKPFSWYLFWNLLKCTQENWGGKNFSVTAQPDFCRLKTHQTLFLTSKLFSVQLTTSDLYYANVSPGKRKEHNKSSGLASACLHSLAYKDGQPNCWQALSKFFI